ncbi:hypothetical protein N7E70_021400 [Aminobacter sp. NyZ550]|jgi:hypothetical protein|uniref:Uncharacterized protein n=2 Tax=Aminobacter TaxID=31988 RepID=A0AAC8YRI8_AMIAI|nr:MULTISPECIES: hypothetical protein [Aminobacter]AMS43225.1 hypothetical protein AA2016_4310 [Aminobacter aminovorans]MBA8905547.1 hypothetical protein [Aminobacter ciceronei]MBA9019154.1 hypothetical protein [Aminobacter ciceronei]MBB3706227.1 hypothetical protein [Aminobacter aminovorans]MRX37209.1 hypothetical protein [Aminobacter sp. MDW-2]
MTATFLMRGKHPARRDPTIHRFSIGQTVRLKRSFGTQAYRITGTLPAREDSPQYRIRNERELHERVTSEDNIELLGAPLGQDDASLIERAFGHG